MIKYVSEMLDGVHYAIGVNAATLSGAVDIVVVEKEKGEFGSTPFHVRFGKLQIIRSSGTKVEIYVNDVLTPLNMSLGRAGEAYFVEKKKEEELAEGDVELSTRPTPDSGPLEAETTSAGQTILVAEKEPSDSASSVGVVPERKASLSQSTPALAVPPELVPRFAEAGAAVAVAPEPQVEAKELETKPEKKRSEVARSTSDGNIGEDAEMEWSWGELPRKSSSSSEAKMSVAKTASASPASLPVVAKKQQEKESKGSDLAKSAVDYLESDKWVGLGRAVAQLFGSCGLETDEIQISLCATQLERLSHASEAAYEASSSRIFAENLVDLERFNQDPATLFSPELVVKLGNQLFPWSAAGPFLCSFLFFGKGLDASVLAKLEASKPVLSPFPQRLGRSSGSASSSMPVLPVAKVAEKKQPDSAKPAEPPSSSSSSSGWFSKRYKSWLWSSTPKESEPTEEDSNSYYFEEAEAKLSAPAVVPVAPTSAASTVSKTASSSSLPSSSTKSSSSGSKENKVLVKSLVPSSKELASLNLKPGVNKVVFSVSTGLRGVQTVSCQLFLWDAHTPVVISDVDGTITRSDVPGLILPYVGRDWSQKGVVDLFCKIVENGYNMLYLTARSIGQANSTRGFISSLTQGSARLPLGPVFMSPDRLIHALNREVVERKPEEFKIGCLESLKGLYPSDFNPFSAGFGNRPSDIHSYLAVGIPELRIFNVNPLGTVTTANVTYKKTYTDLSVLVHEMFPAKREHTAFNEAMFWALPLDMAIEEETAK